jgi:hypothetical protein
MFINYCLSHILIFIQGLATTIWRVVENHFHPRVLGPILASDDSTSKLSLSISSQLLCSSQVRASTPSRDISPTRFIFLAEPSGHRKYKTGSLFSSPAAFMYSAILSYPRPVISRLGSKSMGCFNFSCCKPWLSRSRTLCRVFGMWRVDNQESTEETQL